MKALLMVALLLGMAGLGHVGGAALGTCPATIPPFIGSITVVEAGSAVPSEWVISPTNLSTATPPGYTLCRRGGGYVQQYFPGSCVALSSEVVGSPAPTADGCTYTFADYNMETVVQLTCGNTSTLTMSPIVPVAQNAAGVFVLTFTGSISSVCPVSPPPTTSPPAGNFALTQLVCADSLCSQNCSVYRPPQGQCEPVAVGAGESAMVTCTSASTVTSQLFPQSATCTGPAVTTTIPTGVCIPGEDGTYVTSYCSAAQPAAGTGRRPL